jgi:flagellar FliJ protein
VAFRFSLQLLLRFREGMEQQCLLLLQAANLQAAAVRQEIEALDRGRVEAASSTQRELDAGTSAAQIHFDDLCRARVLQRRKQLQEDLARCEHLRAQRSQAFHQARRQREILATLRDRQFELYREQQARLEQKQLDEALMHQAWVNQTFLRRG